MSRCEEVFRQICWLEERFWPDVDGMGEQDETSRMGPPIGPMGEGMQNGIPMAMNNNMAGPSMNGNESDINMHGNSVNGSMNGPMKNSNMNGPINNGPISNSNRSGPMNNGPINNNNMNGPMSNGPVPAGPNQPNGNGMEHGGQGS
jgi:hypothetical protein